MLKKEDNVKTTEKTVAGFEITEKAVELKKKDFFKMLAKAEEGLILTIERVGKIFISKYDSNKVGCFIDYSFSDEKNNYEIGIYYSLGKPVIADYDSEGQPIYKVKITEGMNIFKILAVAVDLSKAIIKSRIFSSVIVIVFPSSSVVDTPTINLNNSPSIAIPT